MRRIFLVLAMLLCVVNCYMQTASLKAPSCSAPVSRTIAPTMNAAEVVASLSTIGTAIASEAGDFGGYAIPIIGLGLLAAIIAFLAGPVDD